MEINWFYTKEYNYGRGIPFLSQVHGFILDKPARICKELIQEGVIDASQLLAPSPFPEEELGLVHSPEVIQALSRSPSLARALEFPPLRFCPAFLLRQWLVKPQLHAAGGTYAAMLAASQGQWAFTLSGGYHHARPTLSHGFCLINDVALAIRMLRKQGIQSKFLIIDLDLHQGDGNAAAFEGDDSVFTLSIHQSCAFPIPKLQSDLDVPLPRGTSDLDYLQTLQKTLENVSSQCQPAIIVYVAGTDIIEGDNIGQFRMSTEGVLERDRQIALFAKAQNAALVTLPAGGYSSQSPSLSAQGYRAMLDAISQRASVL